MASNNMSNLSWIFRCFIFALLFLSIALDITVITLGSIVTRDAEQYFTWYSQVNGVWQMFAYYCVTAIILLLISLHELVRFFRQRLTSSWIVVSGLIGVVAWLIMLGVWMPCILTDAAMCPGYYPLALPSTIPFLAPVGIFLSVCYIVLGSLALRSERKAYNQGACDSAMNTRMMESQPPEPHDTVRKMPSGSYVIGEKLYSSVFNNREVLSDVATPPASPPPTYRSSKTNSYIWQSLDRKPASQGRM